MCSKDSNNHGLLWLIHGIALLPQIILKDSIPCTAAYTQANGESLGRLEKHFMFYVCTMTLHFAHVCSSSQHWKTVYGSKGDIEYIEMVKTNEDL